MARFHRPLLARLIAMVPLLAVSVPGLAGATANGPGLPEIGPTSPGLETLCDGDCGDFPLDATVGPAGGFQFELGIKSVLDRFDLAIKTQGSVYIAGPIRASQSIRLRGAEITLTGNSLLVAPELFLDTLPTDGKGSPGSDSPIAPGLPGGPGPCGCISIGDVFDGSVSVLGDDVMLGDDEYVAIDAGATLVLATRAAVDSGLSMLSGIAISRSGDIYLDTSMTEFGRLKITAGESIFVAESNPIPVPQPGTATLLGFGLAGLASRRVRRPHPPT